MNKNWSTKSYSIPLRSVHINSRKNFPVRLYEGANPKVIFITHHGIISDSRSWKYLEKWIGDRAIVLNYDARCNGENKMRASRMMGTYIRDMRDIAVYAKQKWPKLKIVLVGSSWGALIVNECTLRYPHLFDKAISWSIPMRVLPQSDDERKESLSKETKEIEEKLGIKETTPAQFAYKFMLMILFNVNAKAYVNIDIESITSNKAIQRMSKANIDIPKTPVKLFYSTWKMILRGPKVIKKINKKYPSPRLLYLHSLKDEFINLKKIKTVQNNNGKGVKYIEFNIKTHALQWETKDNFNKKIFQKMWDFVCENSDEKS